MWKEVQKGWLVGLRETELLSYSLLCTWRPVLGLAYKCSMNGHLADQWQFTDSNIRFLSKVCLITTLLFLIIPHAERCTKFFKFSHKLMGYKYFDSHLSTQLLCTFLGIKYRTPIALSVSFSTRALISVAFASWSWGLSPWPHPGCLSSFVLENVCPRTFL